MSKEQKQEFHVEVRRVSYGYVRVHAQNKNVAEEAIKSMDKKKLLGYYKHRFEYVNIGEVIEAKAASD